MSERATGTFEVSFEPRPSDEEWLGRMRVTKVFAGDLVGTSVAQMVSVGTEVEGSAGYVAIERVTGTLHGRDGSFIVQHSGLMARGHGTLTVTVVPDSGTGDLTGLAGDLTITNDDGKHTYALDYTL
jgi:Protein of unknown function (DUF3224)